mmetsp:Transcript_8561/g.24155  ORF Transcript_8561/g.24155 Transcript_8561/m.24155 type:complete len:252 (-) Transcript_8561:272-1027(-)
MLRTRSRSGGFPLLSPQFGSDIFLPALERNSRELFGMEVFRPPPIACRRSRSDRENETARLFRLVTVGFLGEVDMSESSLMDPMESEWVISPLWSDVIAPLSSETEFALKWSEVERLPLMFVRSSEFVCPVPISSVGVHSPDDDGGDLRPDPGVLPPRDRESGELVMLTGSTTSVRIVAEESVRLRVFVPSPAATRRTSGRSPIRSCDVRRMVAVIRGERNSRRRGVSGLARGLALGGVAVGILLGEISAV